jgi:hypothetical protein
MLLTASAAVGEDVALLVGFVGIGVIVNVLIFYIVGQVLAERRQNQERRELGT